MGLFHWLRRSRARRTQLDQADLEVARTLAPLQQAAPEVADALRALQSAVTTQAYDALDRVAERCADEAAATRVAQASQAEQLRGLRELHSEQQLQIKRLQEGYDWQLIKDFCFRFIRILDDTHARVATLPEGSEHRTDLEDTCAEILFALEASGVEPFEPVLGSEFAGQEKRLKVIATATTDDAADHGKIHCTRLPGYQLVRDEDAPARVLRPAHVEVFASTGATPTESPQLQETSS